jgi:hypothetical protein
VWKDANGVPVRLTRGQGFDWWFFDDRGYLWRTDLIPYGYQGSTSIFMQSSTRMAVFPTPDCTGPAWVQAPLPRTVVEVGSEYYVVPDKQQPVATVWKSAQPGGPTTACYVFKNLSNGLYLEQLGGGTGYIVECKNHQWLFRTLSGYPIYTPSQCDGGSPTSPTLDGPSIPFATLIVPNPPIPAGPHPLPAAIPIRLEYP